MHWWDVCAPFDIAWCVDQIATQGGVCLPRALRESTRTKLLEELNGFSLVPQPKTYGNFNTRQEFESLASFPEGSYFLIVRDLLQECLSNQCWQHLVTYPLSGRPEFTDLVVQRYQSGPVGISPHRDGKSFVNLIAVLVLEGEGDFCFCDDREGNNPRVISKGPGDLILMRGPGFMGEDIQPFHFVTNIRSQRTTFALRQKKATTRA